MSDFPEYPTAADVIRRLEAQRLAAIIDSSDDAIISKDLNGIITSWNGAAERMFGYTAEEMIGRSIRTIIPADRQVEEDETLRRIRAGLRVDHFETIRQRKDGTLLPISLSISPIRDGTGTVVGASKIARDISDRKRAERQSERINRQTLFLAQLSAALTRSLDWQQILRSLAAFAVPSIADWCAVDLLNDDGTVQRAATMHVNPQKVDAANELHALYAQDPDARFTPEHVMNTGRAVLLPEITKDMIVASAKGDERRLALAQGLAVTSYMCAPMIAHGRTLGALTFGTAESRRHYAEDDLRFIEDIAGRTALALDNARAYEQMQIANRLKDEFLATLSHELRTPLNAVLGYARMLKSGIITEDKMPQALDVIERNATSLTQIVEDVLDVSRIISGKVRLRVQAVTLPTVLKDSIATVQPAADAKGVTIETAIDAGVASVSGDPDRLQQVIWNLVSNAVKFTPAGGRVTVRLREVDDQAEICVMDTGAGIAPGFLPHIFERFRQADSTTTRRHGGLGLGLAIARHIVEMHGGTIDAHSEGEGKGSTFRVCLPLAKGHRNRPTARRAAPPALQQAEVEASQDLNGYRILAVDDDEDALIMLKHILESAGASVRTAVSGEEAMKQLQSDRPDVMIADLGMPMMDGFELIKRLRQSQNPLLRRMPAVALTAYARSEDRLRALHAGFGVHIAKPVDPVELIATISALVRPMERSV